MKRFLVGAVSIVAIAGLVRAAQDMGGKEQEPQHPTPSKEHEIFKDMAGTFDCVMKFNNPMSGKEEESKGVETITVLGGFWAVFDLKFESMMGMPWHGHGTIGYDPMKKKYVGSFVHSAAPFMSIGEGTMDAGGKTMTMTWDGIGHSGKPEKMREVYEKIDKDNAKMTMYGPGPDGKEMLMFTTTYKRKK
jgi:hypothetical protein